MKLVTAVVLASVALLAGGGVVSACGSSSSSHSTESGDDGGGASSDDGPKSPVPEAGVVTGALDVAPMTSLPSLPPLAHVVATQREDSVGIDFDPNDDAVDYRVYPLPADGDVSVDDAGAVTVKNAIYRCAGLRQTYDLANNLNSDGGLTPQTTNVNKPFTFDTNGYAWKGQIAANPTLGYVYTDPAPDRIPVYAVAGDTEEIESSWSESRLKIYTTDATLHATLVSQRWRDDGIVFYVPATASAATQTVYSSQVKVAVAHGVQLTQYYFGQADLSKHTKDSTPAAPAFQVLAAAADGTQPLMAVFYEPYDSHTELAVGKTRFKQAANQGSVPLTHVEWTGVTQPTVLVVEALASGCPYQGFLSPNHFEAPPHPVFETLADLQAASPTGEVFINGQYDGPGSPPVVPEPTPNNPDHTYLPVLDGGLAMLHASTMSPKAIARSFVQVSPQPHAPADWDWYQGFGVGTDLGVVTPLPCGAADYAAICEHGQTATWDISAYNLDAPNGVKVLTYGNFLGQLWEAFDDDGSDVTGKVRFTALQKAAIDPDPTKYLHATMSVNMVATDRRYPQLIISDQSPPVQDGLSSPTNNTILVQPIQGPATRVEIQAFHGLISGKPWDVNNQAPEHQVVRADFSNNIDAGGVPDVGFIDHIGMDRMTRFDVYVSSKRIYLFVDGAPAGCTQYPANNSVSFAGPVSITFGDVLYHESTVDELVCDFPKPFPFMHEHQCRETKRHFDDLGFKSGVPAPAWDQTRLPCGPY